MSDKIRYVKPGEIDIFHRWYDNRKDGDACYEGLDEILDKTIGIPVGLENMLSISLETKHTKNGTMYEYLEFYAGADYEYPMYFIIYMSEDSQLLRLITEHAKNRECQLPRPIKGGACKSELHR